MGGRREAVAEGGEKEKASMKKEEEEKSISEVTDVDGSNMKKKKKRRKKDEEKKGGDDEDGVSDVEKECTDEKEFQPREVDKPKKKNKKKTTATMVDEERDMSTYTTEILAERSDNGTGRSKKSIEVNETKERKKKKKEKERRDSMGFDAKSFESGITDVVSSQGNKRIEKDGEEPEKIKKKDAVGEGKRKSDVVSFQGNTMIEKVGEEPAKMKKKDGGGEGKRKSEKGKADKGVGPTLENTPDNELDSGEKSVGEDRVASKDYATGGVSNKKKKGILKDYVDDGLSSERKKQGDEKNYADNGDTSKEKRKGNAQDDVDDGASGKKWRKGDVVDDPAVSKKRKRNVEENVNGMPIKTNKRDMKDDADSGVSSKNNRKKRNADHPANSQVTKKPRRVSFSDKVEVFPPSKKAKRQAEDDEDSLVQGKRFTPEEDEIVKEAVLNYIKLHDLGDKGLDMVMNVRHHREVRGCWKEIGVAIPYRPYKSLYYRAHILFEGDGKHNWSPEEYEILQRHHEKHGADWKSLAAVLGKHRFHVKDAWRRIKMPNKKNGRWSQDEYQTLFDLVNLDLTMRAFEEKKTKHGMLRDNIGWEAISQRLSTRNNVYCCRKWYDQLASPMVSQGLWNNSDDYRLLRAILELDACCVEDIDWDNLLEHRDGDICLRRWKEMTKHIGGHRTKPFTEQVELLASRYCLDLLPVVETYESK